MKRILPRLLPLLFAAVLLVSIPSPAAAAAYTPKYAAEAEVLSALGLFRGSDKGYELERRPTRTEALVLLVRLLGKDSAAKAFQEAHPFTDVAPWADRYVAWAFANGLTKGVSETAFGGNADAGALMFTTFILRALGYDDASGDFTYDGALIKASEIGLIPAGTYNAPSGSYDGVFRRDDCVRLCYQALKTRLREEPRTLASKLVSEGAVSPDAARQFGLIPEKASYTVAIVGDSFTAGYGLDNPEKDCYPAVLAATTGEFTFKTENYGVAGVAVNNESVLSYLSSKTGARSFQTKADIVLVVLGANDAVWTPDMSDFYEDYKQILKTYMDMSHGPKVIVMTPPRLLGLKGYDSLMAEIVEKEKAAARDLNLDIIDVYAFSEGMERYSDDSVHFNTEGHRLVAGFIYDALAEILFNDQKAGARP
jgi:lysophospholipase L1-like esterase